MKIFIDYAEWIQSNKNVAHTYAANVYGPHIYSTMGNAQYYFSVRDFVLQECNVHSPTIILLEMCYYVSFINESMERKDLMLTNQPDEDFPYIIWNGIKVIGVSESEANKYKLLK